MQFREIIAVPSENDTKPTNTLCEENTEIVNVKADNIHNRPSTLNG
jgi:hypothetical protein